MWAACWSRMQLDYPGQGASIARHICGHGKHASMQHAQRSYTCQAAFKISEAGLHCLLGPVHPDCGACWDAYGDPTAPYDVLSHPSMALPDIPLAQLTLLSVLHLRAQWSVPRAGASVQQAVAGGHASQRLAYTGHPEPVCAAGPAAHTRRWRHHVRGQLASRACGRDRVRHRLSLQLPLSRCQLRRHFNRQQVGCANLNIVRAAAGHAGVVCRHGGSLTLVRLCPPIGRSFSECQPCHLHAWQLHHVLCAASCLGPCCAIGCLSGKDAKDGPWSQAQCCCRVAPVFKHTIVPQHGPTLAFFGLPYKIAPNPIFEVRSWQCG